MWILGADSVSDMVNIKYCVCFLCVLCLKIFDNGSYGSLLVLCLSFLFKFGDELLLHGGQHEGGGVGGGGQAAGQGGGRDHALAHQTHNLDRVKGWRSF